MVSGGPVDFVVLYQGRTGSSFLMHALDRHPEITAHGEILNWLGYLIVPNERLSLARKLITVPVRIVKRESARRQLRAVRELYAPTERATRVIGFKTKLLKVRDPVGLKRILEERRARTVVMQRRNYVEKAVAHIYGQRLFARTHHVHGERAWNLFDESDRLGPQHIPAKELESWLERVAESDRRLERYVGGLDVPMLRLEYRDLLRDREAWFGSIFDFLGVEHRALESPVLQNEPDRLRDAIANFDELRAHFRGSRFEPMFEEA